MDLGAISAIGSALTGARIESQFTALVLSAQLDVMQDIGQSAVRLIQAAALDPAVGNALDVQV